MKSHHLQALLPRLINDFQFKEQNGYLRQGVCPNCKKKELFTSVEMPFVLRCGRENKCGAELFVKEMYPDVLMTGQPTIRRQSRLRTRRQMPICSTRADWISVP